MQNDDHIPDQRLFQPDPELENRPPSRWRRTWPYIRALIGGLIVVSLLYISGVYHALLLTETPQQVEQERLATRVDGPSITIPVRVYLIEADDDTFGTQRDRQNARQLVHDAGNIWAQANIDLRVTSVETRALTSRQESSFRTDPASFVRTQPGYRADAINVYLTGTLQGLNGVALGGTTGLAVADVTSHYDFRTLAHEIGHILTLDHRSSATSLMRQATYGVQLSPDEINQARSSAQRQFGG